MAKRETPAIEATVTPMVGGREATSWESATSGELTLTFADGWRKITIRSEELPGPILVQALMHGLKQKLVDAAAISRNEETGASATVEDKFEAVMAVYRRLAAGEWNKRREAGESGEGGLLLRALIKLYDGAKTAEEVKEWLAGKTKAEQAALRENARIKPIIDALRPKVKPAAVDTDAMLGELGDAPF